MAWDCHQWNGKPKKESKAYFITEKYNWIKDQLVGLIYDWRWQEKTYQLEDISIEFTVFCHVWCASMFLAQTFRKKIFRSNVLIQLFIYLFIFRNKIDYRIPCTGGCLTSLDCPPYVPVPLFLQLWQPKMSPGTCPCMAKLSLAENHW